MKNIFEKNQNHLSSDKNQPEDIDLLWMNTIRHFLFKKKKED